MTERGRNVLHQQASALGIGPSSVHWDGHALNFQIEEISVPWPTRLRGRVRVIPQTLVDYTATLDADGRHRWRPIAPTARIEVEFGSPALRWSGDGYCDSNQGDEPLEQRIRHWHWSRGNVRDGTAVVYDVRERDDRATALALRFGKDGLVSEFAQPAHVELPASAWRIARATRSENAIARVERTLEDTPFYARSLVSSRLCGENITSVHESLDLDRFRAPLVQAMLPFRMPRRGG